MECPLERRLKALEKKINREEKQKYPAVFAGSQGFEIRIEKHPIVANFRKLSGNTFDTKDVEDIKALKAFANWIKRTFVE